MFKKITVKLRIFFYILLYMKLSCNSLAEVWGNMEGFENEMTSYKESFELNTDHMNPPGDSNEDFQDIMQLYEGKGQEKEEYVEKKEDNIMEGFLNKIKNDLEDDNNDLILLVILGIFIIFVLDSLLKMKISFK